MVLLALEVIAQPAGTNPRAPAEPDQDLVLAVQVALDRAGFSPGEIDGREGENTQKALKTFQAARGLETTGVLDDPTSAALGESLQQPLAKMVIGADDVQGPFIGSLPEDMLARASLPELGYTSIVEKVAERFHASASVLDRLNPDARYEPGDEITVPNVEPLVAPSHRGKRPRAAEPAGAREVVVTVSSTERALWVRGSGGAALMYAPVSVGSERDPLPVGEFRVLSVTLNPVFHYNPELFWDADPTHARAKIQPGPNNPVGFAWIDLDRAHLGLHGTPDPSTVGKAQSHGCVRLTNWDVLRLASLVGEGTRVVFE